MTHPSAPGADRERWQFWIDRGGTFTDIVARAPGRRARHAQAAVGEPGALPRRRGRRASATCSASRAGEPMPAARDRRGEDGHDGRHQRAARAQGRAHAAGHHPRLRATRCASATRTGRDIFARQIELPELLYERVVEVDERVGADGEVVRRSTSRRRARDLAAARADGHRARSPSCCMHGYRFPRTSRQLAALARELGFTQVSVSHEVSPLMKLVARGDTTVVDAYLSPILRRYVGEVERELAGATPPTAARGCMFMKSLGRADRRRTCFQGKDAILSGPAGGVVGAVETARLAGFDRDHRLRHGRHLDRRRRTTPASTSARSRPRSPACACARR